MIRLIYFSDCEGYIGTEASKILYDEFLENYGKVEIFLLDEVKHENKPFDKLFLELYMDFMKAFYKAKENGAVCFS